MWHQIKNQTALLSLKIKTNAKSTAFLNIENDALKINLHAAPIDGAANKELIRFLAKSFHLKQAEIKIIRGSTSKCKLLQVPLNKHIEEFIKNANSKSS